MNADAVKLPREKPSARELWEFVRGELKPKGKLLTPFNVVSAAIILVAAVLVAIRFATGLGSITNLSQEQPWGLWIGFDVITGVAFAGGAYVLTFMVYVLRMEKYHPIVRVTVLNGFLAYVFYAGALLLDLGRPWNVVNPIIGNSFGLSSVLFLVAWHFLLYMLAALIEFSPAIAEWLGLARLRRVLAGLTLGAVIFGVTLSTLHQSGLGALYMMAKDRIHPLWYSEYIPVLFFVSSIFAGLSMVIIEGTLSERAFAPLVSKRIHASRDKILLGLSRICAGALFVYVFLKALELLHGREWALLGSGLGFWYLLEILGFVVAPCVFFVIALGQRNFRLIRIAAIMTLVGIVLNRLNISVIAYNWDQVVRYFPSWMEVEVTLGVICAEIWAFRWIVNRMPVLSEPPAWAEQEEPARPSAALGRT
jgi:Ni/Fe-hydrogenase subunit HybB-like protein